MFDDVAYHTRKSSKKGGRFCLQNFNRTVSVTDMLRELEWDTLEMRRRKNKLTLTYKLSHSLVDIKTQKFLVPNSETRTRRSHAFKYRIPQISRDLFKFSFFPRSICEWNTLLSDIVNSKSLNCLKTNLVNYLKYECDTTRTFYLLILFISIYFFLYLLLYIHVSVHLFYLATWHLFYFLQTVGVTFNRLTDVIKCTCRSFVFLFLFSKVFILFVR